MKNKESCNRRYAPQSGSQSGITWRDERYWDRLNPQKNSGIFSEMLGTTCLPATMKTALVLFKSKYGHNFSIALFLFSVYLVWTNKDKILITDFFYFTLCLHSTVLEDIVSCDYISLHKLMCFWEYCIKNWWKGIITLNTEQHWDTSQS